MTTNICAVNGSDNVSRSGDRLKSNTAQRDDNRDKSADDTTHSHSHIHSHYVKVPLARKRRDFLRRRVSARRKQPRADYPQPTGPITELSQTQFAWRSDRLPWRPPDPRGPPLRALARSGDSDASGHQSWLWRQEARGQGRQAHRAQKCGVRTLSRR